MTDGIISPLARKQPFKLSKKILIPPLALITFLLSITAAQLVAERYFFDRLIYKKSPIYGYYLKGVVPEAGESIFIKYRARDVTNLIASAANPSVLGASSDESIYTVAILGDSFAFGVGVKSNQRFPDLLEKRLNQIRSTKVINLSLPGDSIVDHYAKYNLARQQLDPDLFIVTIVDNDLITDDPTRYPNEPNLHSQLTAACPGKEFIFDWSSDPHATDLRSYENIISSSLLDQFANFCYYKTILTQIDPQKSLFIALAPTPNLPREHDRYEVLRHTLLRATQERFTTLSYRDYDWYRQVHPVDGHPSAQTHRFYADLLYREITTNPKWYFFEDN